MPTIKDCVLLELALRKGSVPAEKLEQGKTAQKELERFGISKSLGAILVEKNLAAREAVAEIAEEMSSCSIRCPSCGRPNAVSDADRNGNLKCKHCQEAVTCAEGRISDDDLSVSLKSGGRNRREPKGGKAKEARTGQAMSAGTVQAAAAMDSSYIESVTLDDLAPRREVSKFRLEQLAGVSPAGKLYRTMNGPNPAALKVFDRVLCADKVQFKKWMDYMQKVQDLPRAVTLKPVQLFREGSLSYTLRPFAGGADDNLRARLAAPSAPSFVRERMLGILQSLQQFHAAHLVHGNLKPENVILVSELACLSDPGLHLLYQGLPPQERALRLSDCARYHAPEVLQGGEPTTASDVFSAGRILEDILAASPAGGAENGAAKDKDADDWARRILPRLTAADPTERFPSAKEVLREMESPGTDGKPPRCASRRPVPPRRAMRRTAPASPGRSRIRRGLESAGHAAFVLAAALIVFQLTAWYRARSAFASPHRSDEVTEQIVAREIDALTLWTKTGARGRAEAENKWAELRALFQGTALDEKLQKSEAEALSNLPDRGEQELSVQITAARGAAEKREWFSALEAIFKVEDRLEASTEGRELRARILDGLLKDQHMVLVPRGKAPGPKPAQTPIGPFLVDVAPVKRSAAGGLAAGSVTGSVLVGVTLEEAEKLAASRGKRVPTGPEWDRMAAFASEKPPAWAEPYASRIEEVRGTLYEWVDGGDEDDLWKAGYGYCRGGNRPGAPPTHPLRRKKSVGHPDVGVRFIRPLR